MPLFSTPPTAPNRTSGASTFSADMDAFLAYMAGDLHDELTAAALAWGPGTPYCTVGGTANAVTLTTGLSLAALVTGQRVFFVPGVTNTTTTTFNIDGLGAVTGKTPTGVNLPAGYLRVGVLMSGFYYGGNLIISRPVERVGDATGGYTAWEDGTLATWGQVTTTTGAEAAHTFPAAFANTGSLRIVLTVESSAVQQIAARHTGKTTTAVNVSAFSSASARLAVSVDVIAIGRWY